MYICKSDLGRLEPISSPEKGCWISLTAPTEEEITLVSETCDIPTDVLRAALDPEERSYIDSDEGYVMIVINVPTMDTDR
jgi:magnesium transporter